MICSQPRYGSETVLHLPMTFRADDCVSLVIATCIGKSFLKNAWPD